MIVNFSDHAANERTFLSWVRTALAIGGFGIAVPKLELLPKGYNLIGGLALVVVGSTILIVATYRFVVASREIDQTERFKAGGVGGEIALSGLLLLCIAVFGLLIWASSRYAT